MSAVISLSHLLMPAVDVASIVVAGVFARIAARGMAVIEARLHIQFTQQEAAEISTAANHAAGLVSLALQKGDVAPPDLHVQNATVLNAANAAIALAPAAFASAGLTTTSVANLVLSKVDTYGSMFGPAAAPAHVPVAVPAAVAPAAA